MGLLTDLRVAFTRALVPVQTAQITGSRALGFFTQSTWRVPPDRSLADYLALYGQVGWLFAVIATISDSVASIPWKIVQVNAVGEKIEVGINHPAYRMLRKPNSQWSNYDLVRMSTTYFLLTGELFWFIARKMNGEPALMWTLPSHRVQVLPSDDIMQFVRGYVYISPIGDQIPISPEDVMMLRMPNPLNIYRGLGPVQAAMLDVDADLFTAQYQRNFYFNNAAPGGIITVPGGWNEAEWKRLREEFEARHSGAENAGRIAILWGDMEWQAADISARDLQLIENRKLTRDNILGIFHMPRSVMGITEDVNRANAEAGYYTYAKEVVQPLLNMLKSGIDMLFLPRFGEGLQIEYAHQIPENEETRLKKAVMGFQAGLLTFSEGRELLGADVVRDGDWILLDVADPFNAAEQAENEDNPPGGADQMPGKKTKAQDQESGVPKPMGPVSQGTTGSDKPEPGTKPEKAPRQKGRPRDTSTGRLVEGPDGQLQLETRKIRMPVEYEDPEGREKKRRQSTIRSAEETTYELEVKDEPFGLPSMPTRLLGGQDWESVGERTWRSMIQGITVVERKLESALAEVFTRHVRIEASRLMAMMSFPRDFDDPLDDWRTFAGEVEVKVRDSMRGAYEHGGRVASQLIKTSFDVRRLHAEHWASEHAGHKSTLVVETHRKRLRSIIESGLATGANVRQVAEVIERELGGLAAGHAATIARTELQDAANSGAREQYENDGVEKQQWYTSLDERVCPVCEDLHGEVTGIEEGFSDGSDGPPAHANCRCTILPVFEPIEVKSAGGGAPVVKRASAMSEGSGSEGGFLVKPDGGIVIPKSKSKKRDGGPTDVILVRHGSTDWNLGGVGRDRVRGQSNIALDEKGTREAEAVADQLRGEDFGVILTSDMLRAVETADIIAEAKGGCLVYPNLALRSWNLGLLQGRVTNEDTVSQIVHYAENRDEVPDGGESFSNFQNRLLGLMDRILDGVEDGETVVVVSHARSLQLVELWVQSNRDIGEMNGSFAEKMTEEPDTVEPGGYVRLRKGSDDEWRIAGWWKRRKRPSPEDDSA